MEKIYSFIGDATHEDSLDGLNYCIVLCDDAPGDIVDEVMEESEDAIFYKVDRAQMDSLAKSIEMDVDRHAMGDGYLLDLTEPYILATAD
jgi:hypothetical protein